MSSPSILADRDANSIMSQPAQQTEAAKPKSMEYHRQAFEARLKSTANQEHTYVSPSDNIMSPASQKLNAYKNRQFGKGMKGQSLFAKASARNMEKGGMFGDVPKKEEKVEQSEQKSD